MFFFLDNLELYIYIILFFMFLFNDIFLIIHHKDSYFEFDIIPNPYAKYIFKNYFWKQPFRLYLEIILTIFLFSKVKKSKYVLLFCYSQNRFLRIIIKIWFFLEYTMVFTSFFKICFKKIRSTKYKN